LMNLGIKELRGKKKTRKNINSVFISEHWQFLLNLEINCLVNGSTKSSSHILTNSEEGSNSLGELDAELGEVFSCGGQVPSDDGDVLFDVHDDWRHVGTLVTYMFYTLPWHLEGGRPRENGWKWKYNMTAWEEGWRNAVGVPPCTWQREQDHRQRPGPEQATGYCWKSHWSTQRESLQSWTSHPINLLNCCSFWVGRSCPYSEG
jgi:hypothetical protein